MTNGISVLSTYANDILMKENGEVIAKQPGGPILFLESVFKKNKIPYNLFFGDTLSVDILMTKDGEFGRIPIKPKSKSFPADISNWVIVSTLLQEWDLQNVKNFNGKVFVDLQGYVRQGDNFGQKRVWKESQDFAESIFCMKGTREEVSYLPSNVLESQKKRMLIITDGDKGVELFFKGNNVYIPLPEKVQAKNTLGAGDTFFGYFVSSLYKGAEAVEALKLAQQQTTNFLKAKV